VSGERGERGSGEPLPAVMSWYWDPLLGELIGWSEDAGDEAREPWSVGDPDGAWRDEGRCTR